MTTATIAYLKQLDALSEAHKQEIRSLSDNLVIRGTAYYVSCDGDDQNDGKSPETAWKTLARVSAAELSAGDGVLFRRGVPEGRVEENTIVETLVQNIKEFIE